MHSQQYKQPPVHHLGRHHLLLRLLQPQQLHQSRRSLRGQQVHHQCHLQGLHCLQGRPQVVLPLLLVCKRCRCLPTMALPKMKFGPKRTHSNKQFLFLLKIMTRCLLCSDVLNFWSPECQ